MSDRVTAVVLLLLLLVLVLAFGFQGWSYVSTGFTDVLGARAFPLAITVLMVPLTVVLFIEGRPASDWPSRHAWVVLIIALIALVAYALAIEYLGFFLASTGVFLVFGMLPGIGPINGIAILIPISFALGLDPTAMLILFAGIYYGSQYGNSISTILLNVPGTPSSVATALDGHPMAKSSRAGPGHRRHRKFHGLRRRAAPGGQEGHLRYR